MKKFAGKIIAIVLSLTLVFTMSGVAFADSGDNVITKESMKVNSRVASEPKLSDKVYTMSTTNSVTGNIKTIEYSTTTLPDYTKVPLKVGEIKVVKLTPKSTGYMWLDYKVSGTDKTDAVTFKLADNLTYSDGELTNWSYYSLDVLNPGKTALNSVALYVEANKTYNVLVIAGEYVEEENCIYQNDAEVTASVRAKVYKNSANRTLPTDKYLISSGINKAGNSTSDIYYKVVPNKTGLMTVNLQYNNSTKKNATGTITLYNSTKKVKLSNAVQYSSSAASTKAHFGVAKGKVYYVRVQNACDSVGKYGVKYSLTAYTDRAIGTNSSAKKLTKGADVTRTLFTANNSTGTDVYKIYVPKKQTAKFTVNTQNIRSGNITVKVYRNGKQVGETRTIKPSNISTTYTITYGTTKGKANKGTYYVKLTKGAKVSGQYSIKYNK